MYLRFMITLVMQLSYFYCKSNRAIVERVFKQEVLAVELLLDFGEHAYIFETSEGKLKRFV